MTGENSGSIDASVLSLTPLPEAPVVNIGNLEDTIQPHTRLEAFKQRLHHNPLRTDWVTSESKPQTALSGILTGGTMLAGAAKAPLIFGPAATMRILEATHSAPASGALIGASYGIWTLWSGKVLNRSIQEFPATTAAVSHKIPSVLAAASNLPGYEVAETKQPRQESLLPYLGHSLITHTWRGFTAFAVSTSAYVGPAAMEGRSRKAMKKLTNVLGFDAFAVTGSISGGAAELMVATAHKHPEISQAVQHNLSDTHRNLAIALGLVGAKAALNKLGIIKP